MITVACSPNPADYDLARPFDAIPHLAVEAGTIGDTTRSLAVFASGIHELPFGPARRGFLLTHLAIDFGRTDGAAVARLELGDVGIAALLAGGEPSACEHRWEDQQATTAWLECRLPIPRDLGDARLTIRFDAGVGARLLVASPILVAADAAASPDVFVIVIDTARADVLSIYDESMPESPNISALARDGILFDDLRAPSSWTRASVATLVTGLSQTRHHVFDRLDVLPPGSRTLQRYLRDHGYYTMAWSTNPNILPIWGFAEGFDFFVDLGLEKWQTEKPDASAVIEHVRTTLDTNLGVPGFYYLHFMDPHFPYVPPSADLVEILAHMRTRQDLYPAEALTEVARGSLRGQYHHYLAELRDLDRQLGVLIDHLRDTGRYDYALILVVADHGEEFLDHGGHGHGNSLYEEVVRVPGILKLPGGRRAGTRIEGSAGLQDMFPTIASAIGLDLPAGVEGVDVLARSSHEIPRIAQLILDEHRMTAITYEGWKLIVDHIKGERLLYDLTEDPGERNDLIEQEPARAR